MVYRLVTFYSQCNARECVTERDVAQIPRLYSQPIETTCVPETVSPPPTARHVDVEKLGIRTNPVSGKKDLTD